MGMWKALIEAFGHIQQHAFIASCHPLAQGAALRFVVPENQGLFVIQGFCVQGFWVQKFWVQGFWAQGFWPAPEPPRSALGGVHAAIDGANWKKGAPKSALFSGADAGAGAHILSHHENGSADGSAIAVADVRAA